MKWITATHLKSWALRRDSQGTLPLLVRRLIRATSQAISSISFPSGDSVAIGGWDGILEVYEETDYLPLGFSLWEFGVNSDVKGKADEDYNKRKANPLNFNPNDATYIFVTPRVWANKDKWLAEKKAEGFWKDVRVYDADDLEAWLDIAPSVASWLASKHLNIYPSEGIIATDEFWEEWSTGPKINMPKNLLLGGRRSALKALLEQSQNACIIPVEASSREEATAFIISAFLSFAERYEDFFARSIIVDSVEAFRALMVIDKPMFLIIRFEDDSVINRAVAKGHTVLVPLGIETPGRWNQKIALPALERQAFIDSLTESGIDKKQAEELSKQSARNIAVLRRQLEFKRGNSPWAEPAAARELIPALLAGRWNENLSEDKIIIELLSGETYDYYIGKLKKWTFSADAPIVQIGSSWRLTSPMDAWTQLGRFLNRKDFELLAEAFIKVMCTVHPRFELPSEERHRASWHGKIGIHSGWIREGLSQSMILITVYGEKLNLDLPSNPTLWVNHYIEQLLDNPDPNFWKSLDNEIPLIAEAAPTIYIQLLQKYLNTNPSPILALFEEDHSIFDSHSYHTGMLWALENLAWLPEYLSSVSILFAQLAAKDPGGRLSNRPNNSLSAIFKPWFPQTLAELKGRIEALKHLTKADQRTGLHLLIRLLPSPHQTAQPTHKPLWRLNDEHQQEWPGYPEIYQTHSEIIRLIIEFYDGSEEILESLLEKASQLQNAERDNVLKFISLKAKEIVHPKNLLWKKLRTELSKHRSRPSAHWALSEKALEAYQTLYDNLEPTDDLEKILWLFSDQWPAFPEGHDPKKPHSDRENIIKVRRIMALKSIYDAEGISGIINLIPKLPSAETGILGDTIAHLVSEEGEIVLIILLLQQDEAQQNVAISFVKRKAFQEGTDWVTTLYSKMQDKGLNTEQLSKLLSQAPLNQQVWDFIEACPETVQDHYWKNLSPLFYHLSPTEKQYGLKKLMQLGRYYSAIDQAAHYPEELEAEFIVSLLQSALKNESIEPHSPDTYEIEQLMKELEKKGYTDNSVFVQLEWGYLPILGSYGDTRAPRLEAELARNPDFFLEMIELIYQPEEDEEASVIIEKNGSTLVTTGELEIASPAEAIVQWKQQMGYQAYNLLSKWKTIPGVDNDGHIDEEQLNAWVNEVREKADMKGLLETADAYIGGLLARYPEDGSNWPPEPIAQIIQNISTNAIREDFYTGVYNKRGSSVRSPTEGGARERELAKYFAKLTASNAAEFPVVAQVFDQLRLTYEAEAKSEDIRAEKRKLEY